MFEDLPKALQWGGDISGGFWGSGYSTRRERGEGNQELGSWREEEEEGREAGHASWARISPPSLPWFRVFSLVEFPPSLFKYFLIAPRANSGFGH